MFAIGIMSGTSIDGVNVSVVNTDGHELFQSIANLYRPYPIELQTGLHQLMLYMSCPNANNHLHNWLKIENELTKFHAESVNTLLCEINIKKHNVSAIGFHGQTVFHDPAHSFTWQICNPHLLAKLTGINVVSDFRRRDMAWGGQGAPLVPIFHKCLTHNIKSSVAILNIGGIANITYSYLDKLIAFDTGPGNCLINDAMLTYYSQPYDSEGAIASKGKIHDAVLNKALNDDFFTKPPPKSLDRNRFKYIEGFFDNLPPEDIVATLTQLTISTIIVGVRLLPTTPEQIYVCGGGFHNNTLVNGLKSVFNICNIDSLGLNADFIESAAFAYLAVRFLKNLPSTFPNTTGVSKPIIAGVMFENGK